MTDKLILGPLSCILASTNTNILAIFNRALYSRKIEKQEQVIVPILDIWGITKHIPGYKVKIFEF